MDCFHQLWFKFKYGFFPTNDNQDGRQNGRRLSVCIHRGHSYLVKFNWNSSKFDIWFASIKVIQEPCQKITRCFVFFIKVRVIFIYCLKTYKYWRLQKIIYQHICMTKYILTVWSSFIPLNAFPVILVRQFWSEKLIFMRIQCMYYQLIKCLAPWHTTLTLVIHKLVIIRSLV